jgi:isopenicillin N synthase-like dioxygenase
MPDPSAGTSTVSELVTAVDLTPYRLGTASDRDAVARQIDEANRATGFLAVTGHGVDPALIESMREVTQAFFALPTDEKMRHVVADKAANRGYIALGSEALAYSFGEQTPPDLVEGFNIGWEIRDEVADRDPRVRPVRSTFFARNVWPDQPAAMREVWSAYWMALDALGHQLMEVFAVALGLDVDYFEQFISKNVSVLRANHYERRSTAPVEPGQFRLGAHSDYGSCTILLADPVPGLQLLVGDAWHDIVPPEEGFLVNIGDLLAEWTNDRWHSTVHRVVAPGDDQPGPARRSSLAFFQQPDWDATISVLPTCTSVDDPPRYRPTTSGDHLLAKLMGPKDLRLSDVGAEYQRRSRSASRGGVAARSS